MSGYPLGREMLWRCQPLLGLIPRVLLVGTSRDREGSCVVTLMADLPKSGAGGGIIYADIAMDVRNQPYPSVGYLGFPHQGSCVQSFTRHSRIIYAYL